MEVVVFKRVLILMLAVKEYIQGVGKNAHAMGRQFIGVLQDVEDVLSGRRHRHDIIADALFVVVDPFFVGGQHRVLFVTTRHAFV